MAINYFSLSFVLHFNIVCFILNNIEINYVLTSYNIRIYLIVGFVKEHLFFYIACVFKDNIKVRQVQLKNNILRNLYKISPHKLLSDQWGSALGQTAQ